MGKVSKTDASAIQCMHGNFVLPLSAMLLWLACLTKCSENSEIIKCVPEAIINKMVEKGLLKEYEFPDEMSDKEVNYSILDSQIILSDLCAEEWEKIASDAKSYFKEDMPSEKLCTYIEKIAKWYLAGIGYQFSLNENIILIDKNITPDNSYFKDDMEKYQEMLFSLIEDYSIKQTARNAKCRNDIVNAFLYLISNEVFYLF